MTSRREQLPFDAAANDGGREVNTVFRDYIAGWTGADAIDFKPLLVRHPELTDLLAKKIRAYHDVLNLIGGEDAPHAETTLVGREIGGCKVLRVLGQGGMGVVYLAEQVKLRRQVIIKLLKSFAADNTALKERFQRESRIIAKLTHPNIVPVYDVGEHEGSLYIIMKYVAGIPLSGLISAIAGKERADLAMNDIREALAKVDGVPTAPSSLPFRSPTEYFCRLIQSVADAVAHAHELGVIHRDIKPSNIMVEPDGNPVLLDFGMSHDEMETNLTVAGEFIGTPIYSAPESFTKGAVLNLNLLDVYSLGVTMYELLTGKMPYKGESLYEIYSNVKNNEPIPARNSWGRIPRDLDIVLAAVIAKEPKLRYQSMHFFRDDIANFLNYLPITAKPPTLWRKMRSLVRRKSGPLAAGIAIIAALALSLGLARNAAQNRGRAAAEQISALMSEAKIAATDGDYDKAVGLLSSARGIDPANPQPLRRLAELRLRNRRDAATALAEAETLLAMEPSSPDYLDVKAYAVDQTGDTANALDMEFKVLALVPDDITHYEHAVDRLTRLDRLADAEKYARTGLALDGYDVELRKVLINIMSLTGRTDELQRYRAEQRRLGGKEYVSKKHRVGFRVPFLWYKIEDEIYEPVTAFRTDASTDAEIESPPTVALFLLEGVTTPEGVYTAETEMIRKELGKMLKRRNLPGDNTGQSEFTAKFGAGKIRLRDRILFRGGNAYLLVVSSPLETYGNYRPDFDVALGSFRLTD